MKHPLLLVRQRSRLPLFLLFLALTIVTMVALNVSGRVLITEEAPSGIVSYEFAGDVANALELIDSWDETARISAGFNLGLDYLYLLLYSTTIAMALLWLTAGRPPGWFSMMALALAWAQWLAALLDAVENYALLTMLLDTPVEPWPQVAWWCAAIKFALVIAGLATVLASAALKLLGRTGGRNQ